MKKIEGIKEKVRSLSARPLVYFVVLLALAVGAAYVTDKLVQVVGVGQMVEANDRYLEESLTKSGSAFVSLSAIKAGVAVIEGSTVGVEAGVTADLQVGDAVQSVLDFVDMAWRITFFSSAVLFIVRMILLEIAKLGPTVMLIAFLCGAVVMAVKNWNAKAWLVSGIFRRLLWFFLLCTVGIYVALPVTVGAARLLSMKITRPAIEEGIVVFDEIQKETSSGSMNERLFPEGEKLKKRLDVKSKLTEIAVWCKDLFARLFEKGIRFCAGFLFDCLIFPGALLLTVWVVIKKGLAGQGIGSRQSLREDITQAMGKLRKDEKPEGE